MGRILYPDNAGAATAIRSNLNFSQMFYEAVSQGGLFENRPPLDPLENFWRPGILWPGLCGMSGGIGLCGCLCPFVASSFGRMPVCLRQPQHSANGPIFRRESAGAGTA